jgi:hypothetical protein
VSSQLFLGTAAALLSSALTRRRIWPPSPSLSAQCTRPLFPRVCSSYVLFARTDRIIVVASLSGERMIRSVRWLSEWLNESVH